MTSRIVLVVLAASLAFAGCDCGRREASQRRPAARVTPPPSPPPLVPAPSDVQAAPPDAERTATGLASKRLVEGSGSVHPTTNDGVTFHYTLWSADGQMFDSTKRRDQPAHTIVGRSPLPGFVEGLPLMVVGETRRFWLPEELAFGGRPGMPEGPMVAELELLAIEPGSAPPADLARAPRDARCLPSGLCSKVLAPGTGTTRPAGASRVAIVYTAWTSDGRIFDASREGAPANVGLESLFPGFAEGVRAMVVGEKRRLWVPESLAFQGRPGMPAGGVVVEVELVSIDDAPDDEASAH